MARILVIDDDHAVRSVVTLLLTQKGHEVVTAQDGRRGIQTAEREDFDLLIIDLFMPEMDGFETIRTVRKSKPAIPIIVISGAAGRTSGPDFLTMATKLGAIESIPKPFRPDALFKAAEACLGSGSDKPKGSAAA